MGCLNSKAADSSAKAKAAARADVIEETHSPLNASEIESRIERSALVQNINLGALGISYAWMSQRGYYPDGELAFVLSSSSVATLY
jgi:hypothetical protein